MFMMPTPLEAQLTRENDLLRAELKYLKQAQPVQYSVFNQPEVLEVPRLQETLYVRARASVKQSDFGRYHVIARERFPSEPGSRFEIGYFVDAPVINYPKATRFAILADLLNRATFELASTL